MLIQSRLPSGPHFARRTDDDRLARVDALLARSRELLPLIEDDVAVEILNLVIEAVAELRRVDRG